MEVILQLLATNKIYLVGTIFILSLLVGSFLNVVIYRLPIMLNNAWKAECGKTADQMAFNLSLPRSQCPKCRHNIAILDNIPILSYLYLGGKCRQCSTPIPSQYPLIELITALLSTFIAWQYGYAWAMLGGIIFTWTIIPIAVIDFKTMLLPDKLTYPLLWAGLIFNINQTYATLTDAVLGVIIGYLCLWLIYQIHFLWRKKAGLGYGDFKLLGAIGAWGGWQILPNVLLIASILGIAFFTITALLKKQSHSSVIPFAPFLTIGAWIVLFFFK